MTIDIINYRNEMITFETNSECFECKSVSNSSFKTISLAKKEIDENIKTKKSFEPFEIMNIVRPYLEKINIKKHLVCDIREDDRFNKIVDGKKQQIAEYSEGGIWIYNSENDSIIEKMKVNFKEYSEVFETYQKKHIELHNQLKIKTLEEFKRELLGVKKMKLKEAVKILKYHNEWRRGADIEMTDVKILGIAIDTVVAFLEEVEG